MDIPQAYAGLPTQTQADQISRLKGSTGSTKALLMRTATSLFKQFAKDWEAKLVLAPQPIPWEKPNPNADEEPETDETDEDGLDSESDLYEDDALQQSSQSVERTIHNSQQLTQQTLNALDGPAKTHPKYKKRRQINWTVEDYSEDEQWGTDLTSPPESPRAHMPAPLSPGSDPDAMVIDCKPQKCEAIPGTHRCNNCGGSIKQVPDTAERRPRLTTPAPPMPPLQVKPLCLP